MPSKEEVESHSALPTSDLPPRPDQWWTCRAEAEGEGGQHTIGFDLLFDAAGPRCIRHMARKLVSSRVVALDSERVRVVCCVSRMTVFLE